MAKLGEVFKKNQTEERTELHPRRTTKWIHYTKLTGNKYQYCDARDKNEIEMLADLIEADGMVLQDVLVRKTDKDEYEIIGGHKRTAACKLLVEERGKKNFEFLPCLVQDVSDVRAQFQVYSSNGHHEETPYEVMHKLEKMQYLLKNYPEEFPELQSGRMVERLAALFHMKKTTVGEYQSIAKNLSEEAMEAFQEGKLDKSAAVTLAGLDENRQQEVLAAGVTTDTAIKTYIKENLEPTEAEIHALYDLLNIKESDQADRKRLIAELKKQKKNSGSVRDDIWWNCNATHITLYDENGNHPRSITWSRFGKLLDQYIPYTEVRQEEQLQGQMSVEDYPELLPEQKETVEEIKMELQKPAKEQITDEQPKMMPEKSDTQDVPKFGTHKESMIRITEEEYRQLESGKPYIIISRMVSVGERLLLQVFQNGRTTGILLEAKVCWTDTMQTSSGVAKGYTVAVVKWRQI